VIEAQRARFWSLTIIYISTRAGCRSAVSAIRVTAQIIPFGAASKVTETTRHNVLNGGSAHVLSDLLHHSA
jgi:hypothetical protein